MKAADLMIGDWVYNSYHKKNIKWNYSEMFCPNGIPVIGRDLEPIPLTAEILEKNGLEKTLIDEEYCYSLFTMDYVIVIRTNRDGYWKYDSVREIGRGVVIQRKFDYVHELQHALRLCGLDELADKFKV